MTNSTFEPELNCPTPRSLRYRGGFGAGCSTWFVRLFMLPHTLAGLFLLGTAMVSTGVYIDVWLFGADYDGQIVKKAIARRQGQQGLQRVVHIRRRCRDLFRENHR